MILVDANLLVYAYHSSTPEHHKSNLWLDEQFASGRPLALPWESLTSFTRLVSNPRVFPNSVSVAEAWVQVESWLGMPNVWTPVATAHHAVIMAEFYRGGEFVANDVPDVQLATLAISHGLKLATHDHGFTRFSGLRWFDPLQK